VNYSEWSFFYSLDTLALARKGFAEPQYRCEIEPLFQLCGSALRLGTREGKTVA
jgi:hypothetical protein